MRDLLRDAIRDLAEEARLPTDLAAGAMRTGRRLRRRRRATMIAAAASLVLLTTIPYAYLSRTERPPTVVSPVPAPSVPVRWSPQRPYPLPGGWVVTDLLDQDGDRDGNRVLDRGSGEYRTVSDKFTQIWTSPDLRYAAVTDEAHNGKLGILTLATGKVKWTTAGYILDPIWSADSTRILATGQQRFYLVTAASGKVVRRSLDESYPCTNYCLLTWLPGDREIAWAKPGVNNSESSEGTVWSLSAFDLDTGKWTRDVPVAGAPVNHDAWSSDGRHVLVRGDGTQAQRLRIADAATGRIRTQLTASSGYFVSADRVLTWEPGRATLIDLDGRVLEQVSLDPALDGYRLGFGPAPE